MADWTSIPDATFDPDRPVLGSTHLAIVKNFEALAEGAVGAPKIANAALDPILTAAIQDGAVTTAKLSIQTRSFSGSLGDGAAATVSLTDNFAFTPRLTTVTSAITVTLVQNGYRFTSGAAGQSYAITWRYITP